MRGLQTVLRRQAYERRASERRSVCAEYLKRRWGECAGSAFLLGGSECESEGVRVEAAR